MTVQPPAWIHAGGFFYVPGECAAAAGLNDA